MYVFNLRGIRFEITFSVDFQTRMSSVISLHFGPSSNFLGTHLFNIVDEASCAADAPSSDCFFEEVSKGSYRPRCVVLDHQSSAGPPGVEEEAACVSENSAPNVEVYGAKAQVADNPSLLTLREKGPEYYRCEFRGQGRLEAAPVQFWPQFWQSKLRPSSRSTFMLPPAYEPLIHDSYWFEAPQVKGLEELLRHELERTDHLEYWQLLTDCDFSNFSSSVLVDFIHEETPKSYVVGMVSGDIGQLRSRANLAHLVDTVLASDVSRVTLIPYSISEGGASLFEQTSVPAIGLDTVTLAYRVREAPPLSDLGLLAELHLNQISGDYVVSRGPDMDSRAHVQLKNDPLYVPLIFPEQPSAKLLPESNFLYLPSTTCGLTSGARLALGQSVKGLDQRQGGPEGDYLREMMERLRQVDD